MLFLGSTLGFIGFVRRFDRRLKDLPGDILVGVTRRRRHLMARVTTIELAAELDVMGFILLTRFVRQLGFVR